MGMTKFKLPVIQENASLDDLLAEQPLKLNEDLLILPSWANLLPAKKEPFAKEYISFSELVTWMECSMRHKLKYIDNIRIEDPTEHTEFGKIIHDALQLFLSTKKMPNHQTVVDEVKRRFDLLGNRKDLKQKDWEDQVEPILNVVPEFMDSTFPGWEYVGAEVELMEEIEGNHRKFHGYIDGIIKTPKKARKNAKTAPQGYDYHIIDWKTTSWGWGTDKKTDIKKTYQLVFYKHFWSKKLGILPSDIKCGFVLLKRTSKSKERCEYVPVSVGDITTAKALEVLHTSLNYAKKGLYTKNKDSCKFCVYKNTPHCI